MDPLNLVTSRWEPNRVLCSGHSTAGRADRCIYFSARWPWGQSLFWPRSLAVALDFGTLPFGFKTTTL